MAHNEGAMNLIKQDAANKLNFYNKVIPNLPHSLNDLLEKAKSVENKLDTNKNGTNDLGAEGSELNKSPNLNEKQKRDTRFLEFDNFRRVNNYIPKIHINKHKERDKDKIILPFASPKEESYKGIMSLYNNNAEFKPTSNFKYNPMIMHGHNDITMKKIGEENAIPRNDIDYDYSLKPNFYTNRYIEYLYEDRGDKLYEENNVLKNLFDKNPNRDSKNELNFINNNSPYLKAYNDLLEKEKEEIENENKEMYQNEMLRGQEFSLSKTELNNISNFIKNNKGIYNEKSPLETYFEINSMRRKIENPNENSPRNDNDHEESKDKKKYTTDDISFEIDIQGEITKKIRNSSKKQHPRGMVLHGPIAKWYRLNEDHENTKLKGYFDIRKIEFKDDSKDKARYEEDEEDEFIVKDVIENNKQSKKDTIFTSGKILEFGNKTFKYFFHQLQKYFIEMLININKASYSVLKFLSDTQCTSLELSLDNQKGIIEYIFWHPKLQILSIPSSFVSKLNEVMSRPDWECKLITLTIKKSVNNTNSNDNPESDLKKIFNNPASLTIQNIHFIDVSYSKKLLEALFIHIDNFYSNYIEEIENGTCILSLDDFKELKTNKLPIINLSWKKTPNIDGSSKSEDIVNLKGIYYLLMYMLIKALKFNFGTIPEVFNKLDLSESTVNDDISFLVKIITKFKIIKELDISNTRFSNTKKVIDSSDFLSNIKLTNNFTEVFDQQKFYDVTLDNIMNEIKVSKEPDSKDKNYNNNTKIDEDSCYDYSMGILPILEKIYIHTTDVNEDVSKESYGLFKKLKFFRGIYYSDQTSKINQENNNQNFLCEALVEKINKDKKTYCENVFQL